MARKGGAPENLVQNQNRTPEQRRAAAKKAGEASAQAYRLKHEFQKALSILLTDKTMLELASAAIEKGKAGDMGAQAFIRDTMGQKPVEKKEAQVTVDTLTKEQCDAAVKAFLMEKDG